MVNFTGSNQANGTAVFSKDLQSPSSASSYAPWSSVPKTKIVSVEHPYIIKNLDKGVTSLGGTANLNTVRVLFTQVELS